MLKAEELKHLQKLAVAVRRDCIETQHKVGSGHLGGSFSAVEVMLYLYFKEMAVDTAQWRQAGRDVFILSKGRASLAYYSVLARRGFFPVEELASYRQLGSRLQGHSHMDSAPGIECSTGSLGQGLSFGIGIALGYAYQHYKGRVYVMLGDGELQEGQVWEALCLQAHLKLSSLVVLIDRNGLQLDATVAKVQKLEDAAKAFAGLGYFVQEIDGHDFGAIDRAFTNLHGIKPNLILADTVKGKGISFMENQVNWHAQKVTEEEYRLALAELAGQEARLL